MKKHTQLSRKAYSCVETSNY